MSDIQQIAERAVAEAIQKAAASTIERNCGWGNDGLVRDLIRERAVEMLKSDTEINAMIRRAIMYWIRQEKPGKA